MRKVRRLTLSRSLLTIGILTLAGCTKVYDSGNGRGGYYDSYPTYEDRYDGRYNGNRYDYDRERQRRRDLDRERVEYERRRLREERERLARERQNRYQYQQPPYNQSSPYRSPSPSTQPSRCPAGFSPSEQKCTANERKRGCQDIRLPSGLGCVKR